MTNDRQITISHGSNRRSVNWQPQTLMLSDLYGKLKIPARGKETLSEYMQLAKAQQDDLKDVGGFMAGSLKGGRRKAEAVAGRDVVTLDFDTIPAYSTDAVLQTMDGLRCGYCVYSTRKHCETAPRLRILIPLDRTATPDSAALDFK